MEERLPWILTAEQIREKKQLFLSNTYVKQHSDKS